MLDQNKFYSLIARLDVVVQISKEELGLTTKDAQAALLHLIEYLEHEDVAPTIKVEPKKNKVGRPKKK